MWISCRAGLRDWVRVVAQGLPSGVSEPVLEAGPAETCVVAGEEGPLAWRDAEVPSVRVGDDLAGIVLCRQHATDELVEPELVRSGDLDDAVQRRADRD